MTTGKYNPGKDWTLEYAYGYLLCSLQCKCGKKTVACGDHVRRFTNGLYIYCFVSKRCTCTTNATYAKMLHMRHKCSMHHKCHVRCKRRIRKRLMRHKRHKHHERHMRHKRHMHPKRLRRQRLTTNIQNRCKT
uniref:Uncharacterized protein n=1 Tax=Romanomermis culicivorax TaxID=13658 RepID=A0A915L3D5_ROMCU